MIMTVLILICSTVIYSGAEDSSQPYAAGRTGSDLFRIPAMIVMNDGGILTSADVRYGAGSDSPADIDTGVCTSYDNGKTWSEISIVNRFCDFEEKNAASAVASSASFIDSALVQSKEGTVFLICDACPAFIGSAAAKDNGSGYIDGRLVLCDKTTETGAESGELSKEKYPYYIDSFSDGFAAVRRFGSTEVYNGYYVDVEYNLYQLCGSSMERVMIARLNCDGEKTDNLIQANVFYAGSPVKIYPTFYIWLRKSGDNGKTWSRPYILNGQIGSRGFTGVCPGRGLSFDYDGKERLLFAVYDSNEGYEKTSMIFSDDNGATWQRGEKIKVKGGARKTSETQTVVLNDGTLRAFSRNSGRFIGYADSKDGGKTWTRHYQDGSLKYCSNCMVSFINYSGTVDGKKAVIASYPSKAERRLGVIRVGLVDRFNRITWKYEYKVTGSRDPVTFAYSCLAELPDGSIAALYETGPAEITYKTFSVDELTSKECRINPLAVFFRKVLTVLMRPLAFI